MLHRLIFIVLAAAATLAAQSEKPNIIFILVDDMGWSDIGCYGGEIDTPNIDRLAADGIRFNRFYNTSKCFPSRACLLTGTYAQLNGNARSHGDLENAVTLGEALQPAGYLTFAVGKHHGTENLYHRGFTHYYGLRHGASNHFNPGYQRPGEVAPAQKRLRPFCFDQRTEFPYTPGKDLDYYSTDTYTDWAIGFIERYRDDPAPFFLYLSYQAPHDPLQAWPDDIAKYQGVYDVGYEAIAEARYQRQLAMGLIDERFPRSEPTHRPWDSLSEEEQEDQALRMAVYAAMVDSVDQNIGRLLQTLQEQGELDNTLSLFASDNGSSAEIVRIGSGPIGTLGRWASLGPDWANVGNTPFRLYKNDSHEGGIRTPLIAHWPASIERGGTVSEFTGHFIDIMPTLLDLAGTTYPESHQGRAIVPPSGISFASILRQQPASIRAEPIFWEWGRGRAIADHRWKLVQFEGQPWELYDFAANQTETQDIAPERPDLVQRLSAAHAEWLESSAATYQRYSKQNAPD